MENQISPKLLHIINDWKDIIIQLDQVLFISLDKEAVQYTNWNTSHVNYNIFPMNAYVPFKYAMVLMEPEST